MSEPMPTLQAALTYEVVVQDQGRVELRVPFAMGTRVVMLVVQETVSPFDELVMAAQSTLGFWDHPLDDVDWNKI